MADEQQKQDDPVNPAHYQGDECMRAIEAQLGYEGAKAFCHGQVAKYLWRRKAKDSELINCKKAQWYLERLIGLIEKEGKQ